MEHPFPVYAGVHGHMYLLDICRNVSPHFSSYVHEQRRETSAGWNVGSPAAEQIPICSVAHPHSPPTPPPSPLPLNPPNQTRPATSTEWTAGRPCSTAGLSRTPLARQDGATREATSSRCRGQCSRVVVYWESLSMSLAEACSRAAGESQEGRVEEGGDSLMMCWRGKGGKWEDRRSTTEVSTWEDTKTK